MAIVWYLVALRCAESYGCFLLVYDFEDGEWIELGRALRSAIEHDAKFGSSLALSNDGE
jgi:hypothetical protein